MFQAEHVKLAIKMSITAKIVTYRIIIALLAINLTSSIVFTKTNA